MARYKTRKDGSRYKAWRCNEAAKHGSPHIDRSGNQVGCTGLSIRNEDATHIMCLVTKSLKYDREKIMNSLISIIQPIIATNLDGTYVLDPESRMEAVEDAVKEIVGGVEYEDEFYKHILDKMVIMDRDNIDVYLKSLPVKWSFTALKASENSSD